MNIGEYFEELKQRVLLKFWKEEDESRLASLSLEDAVNTLKADSDRMELVYMLIVDALFSDYDYDKIEQTFVDRLVRKHGLSREIA